MTGNELQQCVCVCVCVLAAQPTYLPCGTHNIEAGGDLWQLTIQLVSEVVAATTAVGAVRSTATVWP